MHLTQLRRITKTLSQIGRRLGRHINPGPPKYEAGVSLTPSDSNVRWKMIEKRIYFGMSHALLWNTISCLVNDMLCFSKLSLNSDAVSHLTNAAMRVVMYVYLQWSTRYWNVIDGFVCVVVCLDIYDFKYRSHHWMSREERKLYNRGNLILQTQFVEIYRGDIQREPYDGNLSHFKILQLRIQSNSLRNSKT